MLYITGSSLIHILDIPQECNWNFANIIKVCTHLARYTFFIDSQTPNIDLILINNDTLPEIDHFGGWGILNYSLGLYNLVLIVMYAVVNAFLITSYMYAPVTLWVAVRQFCNTVVPNIHSDHNDDNEIPENTLRILQLKHDKLGAKMISNQIFLKFNELQRISKNFNNVWGAFYFIAILDYIVWLATDLDSGIKEKDWLSRGSSIWHFTTIMLLLYFSSECSRMVTRNVFRFPIITSC